MKRELMFENYKDCSFNDKIILKSQQRFKSDHHNVFTDNIKVKVFTKVLTIKLH